MKYQDEWLNGVCISKGKRECETRYNLIRDLCGSMKRGFSVLDIGANMCYFGLRLIEDFNCKVMAFEFDHFDMRKKLVDANKQKNMIFLKRKVSLDDLDVFASMMHFDLTLCLSVLHHTPGSSDLWIEKTRKFSDNVIVEYAGADTDRAMNKKEYREVNGGELIGYGDSHLKNKHKRPIILYKGF